MDLHQRDEWLCNVKQAAGGIYVDKNAAIIVIQMAPSNNDRVAVQPGKA